jgi:hypothetical protein
MHRSNITGLCWWMGQIDVLRTDESAGFQPWFWGRSSNSSRFPAGSCFEDSP